MINKRKIIYLLVSVVASLLIINVLLGITQKKEITEVKDEISKAEIEKRFIRTLSDFGIQESWIEKKNLRKGKFDSISYKIKIKLPPQVAIPVVIKDLNESFIKQPVSLSSSEEKINGFTSLMVKSGNSTKLISEFRYGSKLVRETSQIGFLIIDLDDINDPDYGTLLKIAIPFGVLLPLESNSQEIAEEVKSNNINYFVNLTTDSDNIDFELANDFELTKLSKNIKNIISSFNSPRIFFIDDKQSGFDRSLKTFIKDEFMKRSRKLITLNNYVTLKGENEEDLISLVNFHLNNIKPNYPKVFRISTSDFIFIQEELFDFIKKGNEIVSPSRLILNL